MGIEMILAGLAGVQTLFCAWLAFRPPSSSLARRITRRMTQLEIEWSETFDKLESLVGRITKRDGLSRKKESLTDDPGTVPPSTVPLTVPGNHSTRSQLLKFAMDKRRLHAK